MIIYKSVNKINGKTYVGKTRYSTINLRKSAHIYSCRNNRDKTHFHLALKKYGPENFEWTIIEYNDSWSETQLNEKEAYYIAYLKSQGIVLYNKTMGGDGGAHSEETKHKLSLAHKGKRLGYRHPPEVIAKMKSVKRTKAHKAAIIASNKRRIVSEETKRKIKESWNTRRLRATKLNNNNMLPNKGE